MRDTLAIFTQTSWSETFSLVICFSQTLQILFHVFVIARLDKNWKEYKELEQSNNTSMHHSEHISHEKVTKLRAQRNIEAGFTWVKQQSKALHHELYRSTILRLTNTDYQIQYPNECRNLQSCDIVTHVHPEALKRITHDHLKRIKMITPPTVQRPVRLNRTVG